MYVSSISVACRRKKNFVKSYQCWPEGGWWCPVLSYSVTVGWDAMRKWSYDNIGERESGYASSELSTLSTLQHQYQKVNTGCPVIKNIGNFPLLGYSMTTLSDFLKMKNIPWFIMTRDMVR